ncbi:MAG: DUF3726 domain-containing protein [Gammaproteobacteria bacterium]|nr:DUF3726 domain-containing protein [Gammaproteobacteria bacterium]MDH3857087.1 DUF3726 domain-containing protein [Gammaproteobacteria bacterium]
MSYNLTLAESESYLRKAARACGLDWGIAEEAGKAARWLAAFNLPGPEIMLAHLQDLKGQNYRSFVPDCSTQPWQSSGALLCPIITGAALADRSAQMLEGAQFSLGPTAYPLLLAATVGQAARCHQTVFTTAWAGVSVSCFENGLSIEGNRDDLTLSVVDAASCYRDDLEIPQQMPSTLAYKIDSAAFKKIAELAFQTYAPATEASRAGAGAGLTDND